MGGSGDRRRRERPLRDQHGWRHGRARGDPRIVDRTKHRRLARGSRLRTTGAVTGRRSLPWPGMLAGIIAAGAMVAASGQGRAARITWDDVAPLAPRFEAWRLNASEFPSYIERIHQQNRQRVREGDLDHLVFYLLQSTRFTTLPAIEPAVSARTLVESLDPPQRSEFLNTSKLDAARVPAAVRSRIAAFERALDKIGVERTLDKPGEDARLRYFRDLLAEAVPKGADLTAALDFRVPARDALRLPEGVRRPADRTSGRRRRRSLSHARVEHRHGGRGGLPRAPRPGGGEGAAAGSAHPPRADRRPRHGPRAAHRFP